MQMPERLYQILQGSMNPGNQNTFLLYLEKSNFKAHALRQLCNRLVLNATVEQA